MAVFVFMSSAITSYAEVTEESIKAKENQISEAKKERDSLKMPRLTWRRSRRNLRPAKQTSITISLSWTDSLLISRRG